MDACYAGFLRWVRVAPGLFARIDFSVFYEVNVPKLGLASVR